MSAFAPIATDLLKLKQRTKGANCRQSALQQNNATKNPLMARRALRMGKAPSGRLTCAHRCK